MEDVKVWSSYSKAVGLKYGGEKCITEQTPLRIINNMQDGYVTAINLDTGEIGHSVVMQKVILQTATKISGKQVETFLYYVMDPSGGYYHKISRNMIINAKNVFYIWR
ncbi:MAG: hypothetical protein J6Z14_07500 [Prevotella sp.]|nr:hypothetical protein [Prevotella sp.]